MTQPFVAEIRLFSFAEVPQGWVPCDGRLLQIASNQPLFSLLGFRQGGDFNETFALPMLSWSLEPFTFAIALEGAYPRDHEEQMEDAFPGEIRLFGGSFVPAGWAVCDGHELNCEEHAALYALIGRAFGGGESTFKLPDLRDRVPPGLRFIISLR